MLVESGPALVARPSLSALIDLSSQGPLSALSTEEAQLLIEHAELVCHQPGITVVEQYHRGNDFYLLLEGQVDFLLWLESAGEFINVGTENHSWTPVGWSAFRAPHRYATTVRTRSYAEFLQFRVEDLERLFADRPCLARHFFEAVARDAESLLESVRERLLVAAWGDEGGEQSSAGTKRALTQSIAPEEAMVTNAAPNPQELLGRTTFFEVMDEELIETFAHKASIEYFVRGQEINQGPLGSTDLLVLAAGRVRHEYRGGCGRQIILPQTSSAGEVMKWPRKARAESGFVQLRATRDGALLRLTSSSLDALFLEKPELGALFQRRVLWLLSRRLLATRAHLVSEAHEREIGAVNHLLEQVRTELKVSSTLHKLPHLLASTFTLPDGLAIIDTARGSVDRVESQTAKVCFDLVQPLRREVKFFAGLQRTFEQVVGAPESISPSTLRAQNAESFAEVFSEIPHHIKGTENLPKEGGCVFIFNHLRNHEHNTLPNGFQLTLDCHFISSMILHRFYGDPGIRVVRKSRGAEYGHHAYYSRLGHISVYTPESDRVEGSRGERFESFRRSACEHLGAKRNLMIAPEGTSYSTEESPGALRSGAFRLAASLPCEPLIVPIAVANFDRRLGRTSLVATVHPPFRVTERVADPENEAQMSGFLHEFHGEFQGWVRAAASLSRAGVSGPTPA